MKRKTIVVAGVLALGGIGTAYCAPRMLMAQTSTVAHSQAEFDKLFEQETEPKALNAAGHAFDNQHARLFWFTDLEAAKKQAKAEGKPILSLRLLGKLSDEYSCANSRFFRVLLYANQQINPVLRDKFILHWSSERPVPVITIDYGDGRKLKQTITGNSAHYLLDETGRPLDVLPGLYSPEAFESWLTDSQKLATDWKTTAAPEKDELLSNWHEARMVTIWSERFGPEGPKTEQDKKWVQDEVKRSLSYSPLAGTATPEERVISARRAAPLAISKVIMEAPKLNATNLFAASETITPWIWGNPTQTQVKLDVETRARIRAMNPRLSTSPPPTISNLRVARVIQTQNTQQAVKRTPFDNLILGLENSVAQDTAANKYRMEIPIHTLFVKGEEGNLEALNRTIYDKLFLTPKSDPYLGLASDGVFTGLQDSGIIE